jgi:hypothetical protein
MTGKANASTSRAKATAKYAVLICACSPPFLAKFDRDHFGSSGNF